MHAGLENKSNHKYKVFEQNERYDVQLQNWHRHHIDGENKIQLRETTTFIPSFTNVKDSKIRYIIITWTKSQENKIFTSLHIVIASNRWL